MRPDEFFEEKMRGTDFSRHEGTWCFELHGSRLRGLGGLFHQRVGHSGRHEAFRNSAGPDSGGGGCGRGGRVTDKVIRVPSGKGKPQAIREVIARTPDAVFGNSIWDADMLEIARHPFAINPTPELLTIARRAQWPVYLPESSALSS